MWNPYAAHLAAYQRARGIRPSGFPVVPMGAPAGMIAGYAPNPAYQQAYYQAPQAGPVGGQQTFGAQVLSNADKLWLHRRALWLTTVLATAHGAPNIQANFFGANAGMQAEIKAMVAALTATAFAGNDYDYITGGPTQGYSEAKFQAAHVYVYDNFMAWWLDVFPPQGGQQYPGGPAGHP